MVGCQKKRTPSFSGGFDIQAALSKLFSLTPDANNPCSNVSDHGIRESLSRMSTYKVPISFRESGNHLASDPSAGMVSVYTHYANVVLKLPLSPFLRYVMCRCELMLSQFPPASLDRLLSFAQLSEACGVEPSLAVFTIW